jgi:hypothetical protein
MSRPYVIQFNNVSVSAAQDLFNVAATSGMSFMLHQFELNSENSSSAAELRVVIKRLTATVTNGSGGSAATISPIGSSLDTTATVTGRLNDTTRATTSGTTTNLFPFGWNVLNGLFFCPPPEIRPVFGLSQNMLIGLETAPASATTMNGYVVIEELF